MSYQENYEKLDTALNQTSERLKDLLSAVDSVEEPAGPTELTTLDKLKEVVKSVKADKENGKLTDNLRGLLKDLTGVLGVPAEAKAEEKKEEMKTTSKQSLKPQVERKVLSARMCVVCHRDDRPGQQRKSGFKCNECIGKPSNLDRQNVSFDVKEIKSTKDVDVTGKKFIDDYDFGNNVGKGAFGKVKTCTHKKSGQVYAMKIVDRRKLEKMKKPGSATSEFDKVMGEIALMKSLQHPNVVRLYEVVDDIESGKVYLIMEFCGGGRIFDLGESGFSDDPGLAETNPEKLKQYIVAIANGLDYLHTQHIYHRDLKPDNILVDDSGFCKLTDFGVSAKTEDDDTLKDTEGTPAFNAPEEFGEDPQGVDGGKADIWSFGVTIFAAAFGYLPFMGNSIAEMGEAIKTQDVHYPEDADELLVELLKRFLVKDPSQRIQLQEVLDHRYVEDVRIVKGQAVETVTCKVKSVEAREIADVDPDQLETIYNCDALFVNLKQGNRAFPILSEYTNTKGGIYQVVQSTPDSCTLFRPRSLKRLAKEREEGDSGNADLSCHRDMSFSFLAGDPSSSFSRPMDRNRSTADDDAGGTDLLDSLGISLSSPAESDVKPSVGGSDLLDSLGISLQSPAAGNEPSGGDDGSKPSAGSDLLDSLGISLQ